LPFRAFNSRPCKLYFFYFLRGFCVTSWLEEGEAHARKEHREVDIILLMPMDTICAL
jgi:hypothetical protein